VTVAPTDPTRGTTPIPPPAAWTPGRRRNEGAGPYLRALRSNWVLILQIVVVALVVAGAYTTIAAKQYQAQADLIVTPIASDDPAYVGVDVLRDSAEGSSVVTAAALVTTPGIVANAAARLHVPQAEARADIAASPLIQSSLVSVSAQASSPALAQRLANAFAAATVAERTTLYRASISSVQTGLATQLHALPAGADNAAESTAIGQRLAALASLPAGDPSIRVLSPAIAPTSPSWPKKTLILGAALAIALIIGIGIALAREFLTQEVTQEDEFLLEQRLPVLARVPRISRIDANRYLTGTATLPTEVWESYRRLRVLLQTTGGRRSAPQSILITSAIPGEAKTMTAVNLAVTLAHAGERVVLVDGDLRRPMIASVFGAPADAADVWKPAGFDDRLGLVTTLPAEVRSGGAVDAVALRRWFTALLRHADVIVIDSAPVTEMADTLEIGSAVDAVLLTVRLGTTRRDRFEDARGMMALRGVVPSGLVLTTRARGHRYGAEPRRIVIPADPPAQADSGPGGRASTNGHAGEAAPDLAPPGRGGGPAR
jgi:Mrp family chromosome partitioning ATPase/capsular polysaccharide biosynthesis protein